MRNKKILVISVLGIGNTILFTPFLNNLRRYYPKAKIDFLTLNQTRASVVSGGNLVDNILILPKNLFKALNLTWKLREEQYDYSITAFPSNKWQYNLLSFLIRAKERITHSYQCGQLATLSFLQNKKIPAIDGIHDVEQNMNLGKIFGMDPDDGEKKLIFYISDREKEFAEDFFRKNHLGRNFIVGIGPGSLKTKWQVAKRWPAENFAELADILIKTRKANVLIFGRAEENNLKNKIKSLVGEKDRVFLVNTSLKKVAAIIQKCNLFISNDSGLMHIAMVMGVKTIGIFGPTNYKRTAPYGKNGYIIRKNLSCSPCLKYPFYSTSSKIRCKRKFECLRRIRVKEVISKINEIENEGNYQK